MGWFKWFKWWWAKIILTFLPLYVIFFKIVYSDNTDESKPNHALTVPINNVSTLRPGIANNGYADNSISKAVCMSQRDRMNDEMNVCVSSRNESIGDKAPTTLSEFDNDDLPDIHTLYTKTLRKSTRL